MKKKWFEESSAEMVSHPVLHKLCFFDHCSNEQQNTSSIVNFINVQMKINYKLNNCKGSIQRKKNQRKRKNKRIRQQKQTKTNKNKQIHKGSIIVTYARKKRMLLPKNKQCLSSKMYTVHPLIIIITAYIYL